MKKLTLSLMLSIWNKFSWWVRWKTKHVLWGTARNFNIDSPEVIQCNFATTLTEEARSPSSYESIAVPRIYKELHSKCFLKVTLRNNIIFLKTIWISTSETTAMRKVNVSTIFSLSWQKCSVERTLCPWLWICIS